MILSAECNMARTFRLFGQLFQSMHQSAQATIPKARCQGTWQSQLCLVPLCRAAQCGSPVTGEVGLSWHSMSDFGVVKLWTVQSPKECSYKMSWVSSFLMFVLFLGHQTMLLFGWDLSKSCRSRWLCTSLQPSFWSRPWWVLLPQVQLLASWQTQRVLVVNSSASKVLLSRHWESEMIIDESKTEVPMCTPLGVMICTIW